MEKPLLTIEHVTKKFGNDLILDDISLSVRKREVIVLLAQAAAEKVPFCVASMRWRRFGAV